MTREIIEIAKIDTESGTQSRADAVKPQVIAEYAERMIEGDRFPAIDVFFDGEHFYPSDGHQRIAATKLAFEKTRADKFHFIEAEVSKGSKRDAILASAGANANHGQGRTAADKRRAVETLLRDEEWAQFSDREIARRCKVSPPFVGDVRFELSATVNHLQSTERIGADGRTINTANIGATTQHWAFRRGHDFWEAVDKFHLDRQTILEQLQPDGAASLTDLTLSELETFTKLSELAQAKLEREFPRDALLYHAGMDRIYRISIHQPTYIMIADINQPPSQQVMSAQPDGLTIASQEQIDAYRNPPFPLDTMVLVDGNDTPGTVIDVKVTQVLVSRKNPDGRGNNSHWASLEDVSKADESDENEKSSGGNEVFNDPMTLYGVEPSEDENVERARQLALEQIGSTMTDAEDRIRGAGGGGYTGVHYNFGGGFLILNYGTPNTRRLKYARNQVAITLALDDGEHLYRFNIPALMTWKLELADAKSTPVETEFQPDQQIRFRGPTKSYRLANNGTWALNPYGHQFQEGHTGKFIRAFTQGGDQLALIERFTGLQAVVSLLKIEAEEQTPTIDVELKAGDKVKTRTGHEGVMIERGGVLLVKTAYGIQQHPRNSLTKIEADEDELPDPTTYRINDANGVQLAVGDTVITRHGKTGIIRKLSGSLVNLEGDSDNEGFVGTICTKIEPAQPGDDQAVDDELHIDDELADQALTDDGELPDPIHINDPDLFQVLSHFNQRFSQGEISDTASLLGDIQDCIGYLKSCQDTLNNLLETA